MADCWFCEKKQADPDSAVIILFSKAIRQYRSGPDLTTEFEEKEIPVPRCKECEDRIQKSGTRNMIGGSLLLFFVAGGFLLKAIFPDFGIVSKYVFPCSAAFIGVVLGTVITMTGGDIEDIKPSEAALEYHTVRRMCEQDEWVIAKGWERDLNKLKEKEKVQ